MTLSNLGNLTNNGGTISFDTTFDLGNGTLSIGNGSSFGATILNGGEIQNGTIVDNGTGTAGSSAMTFTTNGATLSNITYDGTINLTAANTFFAAAGNFVVNNTSGTPDGTVNLTGNGVSLGFDGTMSFNNAIINLGNSAGAAVLEELGTDNVNGGPGNTLTLGSGVTINHAGKQANITSQSNSNTDTIVNDGTIDANLASATLSINPANFTNGGTIAISGGDTVDIEPSNGTFSHGDLTTFTNVSTGNITIASGSALTVGITTSSLISWSNAGFIGGTGGTGMVGSLTSGIGFGNSGTIDLGGGTLTAPSRP